MKFFPILLLSVFWIAASGQKSPKIETTSEAITWNGVAVNQEGAYMLETKVKILRYDADPERNMVYVQTHTGTEQKPSRKGKLIAYDTDLNKIRWTLDMRYKQDNFLLIDSIPIHYHPYYSTAYDWRTGDEVWRKKGQIMLSAENEKLAIGFDGSYSMHSLVYAVSVSTGEEKWKSPVESELILESAKFFSDTAVACLSDGLIYMDLKTGNHFYQKQKMPLQNAGPVASYAGAALFGGLLGLIIVSSIYKSSSTGLAVGNLQTGFVYFDEHFYSFHKNELRKYNMEGEIVWATECLDFTGSPKLFAHREDLFVVQEGIERRFDGSINYGFSGIMRVGTTMGQVKAVKQITSYKDDVVRDYIIKDSTIVVASDSKIIEYNLRDFEELTVNDFGGGRKKVGFTKILNPPAYVEAESKFRNATEENPNHFYTTNTADQKIEFDGDFEMVSVVRKRNFFQERRTFSSGLKCLENEYRVVFVDKDDQQVGDIYFTPNMQIEKDYILDRTENRILFLPVEAIGGLR